MTTPSSGPLKFSHLADEYLGKSDAKISLSQLGYGGSLNQKNACTEEARADSNIPLSNYVIGLPLYSGPGSNINMFKFYNRAVYAAPPDGAITVNGTLNRYNFTGFFETGRNYNPNQNRRGNPLFMHLTNNGYVYSDSTSAFAGTIDFSSNAIVYFKNKGSILGDGGDGGGGGTGQGGGSQGGGAGGGGGPAFYSGTYLILDNDGAIYGGGGGGGGGKGTHQSYNECWPCGPSNRGDGGGGGGGGQTGQVSIGGGGGRKGPQGGSDGQRGGNGYPSGPGGGGGGNGAGGGGGTWGSGGGNGGNGGGGGGGGGTAYLLTGGKIKKSGSVAGGTAIGKPASSLSASGTFSSSYAVSSTTTRISGGRATFARTTCGSCSNPITTQTWTNVSTTTVVYSGSGLVVNVTRVPSSSSVSGASGFGFGLRNCGTCNYYWYYTASVVSAGNSYIPGYSVVRVSVDGRNIDFTVY